MKETIQLNLTNPAKLESLYRSDKSGFRKAFFEVFPAKPADPIAICWYERLQEESSSISWGRGADLLVILVATAIATLIAKIPDFFSLKPEEFFPRNISFIILPVLAGYFMWLHRLNKQIIFGVLFLFVACAAYINWLPGNFDNDTFILSCIHLPLVGWSLLGFVYGKGQLHDWAERPAFLRFNGDLIVMGSLIVSGVMVLSGITMGLFSLIGLSIEDFYTRWILIAELSASPLIATYVIRYNPQLVNKVSPVIARIFSPLVLVTLVAYLIGILIAGKDPYTDRDFLMLFNALLIGVLAIIFFSVVEMKRTAENKLAHWIIFLLALVTIVVNGVALSAIVYRIGSWGFTPNRLAVLGGNLLFFINLILLARQLFRQLRGQVASTSVEEVIARYLPVYFIWAVLVTFLFPLIFRFQ
ncbi:MAG: hypothetical protein KGO80_01980 [Bacteroidetes bacterium]|nr:hypothetical protein [Bacteroidota bacterium]